MEPQLFWEIYSSFDYLGCNAAAIMLNSTSNNKSGHNTAQNFEGGLFSLLLWVNFILEYLSLQTSLKLEFAH